MSLKTQLFRHSFPSHSHLCIGCTLAPWHQSDLNVTQNTAVQALLPITFTPVYRMYTGTMTPRWPQYHSKHSCSGTPSHHIHTCLQDVHWHHGTKVTSTSLKTQLFRYSFPSHSHLSTGCTLAPWHQGDINVTQNTAVQALLPITFTRVYRMYTDTRHFWQLNQFCFLMSFHPTFLLSLGNVTNTSVNLQSTCIFTYQCVLSPHTP